MRQQRVDRSGAAESVHTGKEQTNAQHSLLARNYSVLTNTAKNKPYINPALYILVELIDLRTSPELPQWNPPASSVTPMFLIPV